MYGARTVEWYVTTNSDDFDMYVADGPFLQVLITAIPFFLFRLSGSRFRGTFSSYLSIAYIASEFIFTAHAMATSKSVRLRFIPFILV